VLAGMGLQGLQGWARRKTFFLQCIAQFDAAPRGDPHWLAIQFMKSQKVDREAARLLLESFEDASPDWLAAFAMPSLVVCGRDDRDNGSPEELAAALPDARLEWVPGTHMSSVTQAQLGGAIARFLAG
jgi:pimeloyl-ACP methyl ester carboxylesterase